VFYGYWDWRFCSLLLISTVVDFYVSKNLDRTEKPSLRKALLFISIAVNLGILGFFKYFQFFVDSVSPVAGIFGGNLDYLHMNVILPVGISFYTFQTMSYTIDVYRKKIKSAANFADFSLYVSFFPQLVAGPIERAGHLLPQIKLMNTPTRQQVNTGIILIVTGLFKKVMIGDTTGKIVDNIFANPEFYKSDELLAALILFSIQIYADFSGYSSIARGTARLFGIELMRNFEQPYLSSNITEFWRRWHISLSTWLRDYLYIPLGGSRKGKFRTELNIMLTMLLGGLWHGANWTFVIWGGLHGLYLIIHKLVLRGKEIKTRFEYTSFKSLLIFSSKVILTFSLVLITWLFFRAESFSQAFLIIGKFINWENGEFTLRFIRITGIFLFVILVFDVLEYYTRKHSFLTLIRSIPVRYAVMSALLFVTLIYMFQSEPLPFIYFQF
jgi:D-alanyl-lipoteichoic acid acyltransferase DltB (MBOAT superfamily)